jgi:hypothetical protein
MISPSWGWAAARATGTSHIKVGKGCDDFGACAIIDHALAPALVIVVSDGAGSAEHSAIGSRLAAIRFMRCVSNFMKSGGTAASITQHIALEWLDDIRDRISKAAIALEKSPRDFASTLVGCVVGSTHASFIHVGDGAAVFKLQGAEEWKVGSWPTHGEYASTTYFVTDDPQPNVVVSTIEGEISEISVFSDGLERLVLDFSNQSAFAPFFDRIFQNFDNTRSRRDRALSRQLQVLLESKQVCEKTDDDKTIFLARRV